MRSPRLTARVVIAATTFVLVQSVLDAAVAQSSSTEAVGTWTRNPLAVPPPTGGVAVANAPDGPVTVSAVRLTTPGLRAVIRLRPADAVPAIGAEIQACATDSDWRPAVNGSLADAPEADCAAGAVTLAVDGAGEFSGDVSSVLAESASFVLLPGPNSVPVFALSFGPPIVEVRTPGSSSASDPPAPTAPPVDESPQPDDAFGAAPPAAGLDLEAPAIPPAAEIITALPQDIRVPLGQSSKTAVQTSGRDFAQAVRLLALSLFCGAVSVPIFRLRDGESVPGASAIVGRLRGRRQVVEA